MTASLGVWFSVSLYFWSSATKFIRTLLERKKSGKGLLSLSSEADYSRGFLVELLRCPGALALPQTLPLDHYTPAPSLKIFISLFYSFPLVFFLYFSVFLFSFSPLFKFLERCFVEIVYSAGALGPFGSRVGNL